MALPAVYLLIEVPWQSIIATGNAAWLPDNSGLFCILVALACLAHAPRAWSRRSAGSGVWSLTLMLLAALAGAYRIVSLNDYLHDPHLIAVSVAELLILALAAALVVPAPSAPRPPHPDRHRSIPAGMRTTAAEEDPGKCRSSPCRACPSPWPAC